MESRSFMLPVGLLVAFVASATSSQTSSGAQPSPASVDKIFEAWSKPDVPGCALGVISDGALVYSAGYGMANIEHGVRNSAGTVFHIASISKQFTAFAIHLLAHDGKLALDDDIRKYLPELHDFGKTITVRHLIHHTSGLRDQWNLLAMAGWRLEDVITEEDILNLVRRQRELNFAPGDEELYSNTGYTLLGIIVKRVSGQSLREFTAERIFAPLGMIHTRFQDDYGFVIKNRASSYAPQPNGPYKYIALSYSNVGATSLHTTVEDLARWDANFYDARVGGEAVRTDMLAKGRLNSGKEISYASALVHGEYRGLKIVEHGGGDAGFRATLTRFPEQRFSVVVLCNAAEANPANLARAVADLYVGDQMKPKADASGAKPKPPEIKVQEKVLRAYVGSYELRPGFVLTITLENGQLISQATGQPKFAIFPASRTDFFVKEFDASITFEKPMNDLAPALVLHQNGMDMRAPRTVVVKPNAEQLAKYAGVFHSEELDVLYRVTVRDGALHLHFPRGEYALQPTRPDGFAAGFPIGRIEFECTQPNCVAFKVSNGRVRNLRFRRVVLDHQ